jgi:Icc-related predicted phosphoesterase/uncharacterized protein YprB with RNaseH-like and TPR domain
MMRLLFFSDWRVQPIEEVYRFLRNLKDKPDFILYAGDDLARFADEGINHFSEMAQYTRQQYVLAVAGNDDFPEVKIVLESKNVHDLYNSPFIYQDFAFMGVEASTSGPALLQHSEEEVERHLRKQVMTVTDKTLIILSHAPPYGTLDLGIRFARPEDGASHIGSTALRDFIMKSSPQLVVCGHCHSQGKLTSNLGKAKIVNVSSHDAVGSEGNFALIDIDMLGHLEVEFHDTLEQIASSSLLNLHGAGPAVEEALSEASITTIDQLVKAPDLHGIAGSCGIPISTLSMLKAKAKSLIEGEIYKIKDLRPITGDIIFFDIETDIARERVWLVGALRGTEFRKFYADIWEQEREMLGSFLEYLSHNQEAKLVSFSGVNFDRNVVEKALRRLRLDFCFFLSHTHVDVCQQVKEFFIFPNQSYALKDLASFLGYKFKYPELCGLLVALEYHRHIQDKTPLDPRLFEYNEDDVKALPFILEKLKSLNQAKQSSSIAELAISEKQKAFRDFVEKLKTEGVTGSRYREKVAEWNRARLSHPA